VREAEEAVLEQEKEDDESGDESGERASVSGHRQARETDTGYGTTKERRDEQAHTRREGREGKGRRARRLALAHWARVAAAAARTRVPRSLHLVWNTTRSPSFHISVTSVSPGNRTPAKRTLILEKAPYLRKMCLPEMPNEHRPCRIGESKPPTLAKLGERLLLLC